MSYTVLARRYRSQTFDDVVGQQAVAQTLRNAIVAGRVAHAYLFTGTRGVGKTTMARLLAKALNCLKSDGPTVTPCCACDSCVAINNGDDIDVIEIDGASNNSVENIRDLRQNAIYRPARARFKIYIIDEVHMLSTSAFNALLKILEEPPDHVKFIFATTEVHKVLPTIQSRCQRFDFRAISPSEISEQLGRILKKEKIAFEKDLLLPLARLANGSMRDGLSVLDQLISAGTDKLTVELLDQTLGRPSTEKIFALVQQIGSQDAAAVLQSLDELLVSGQTALELLDSLIDIMRDIMVLKAVGAQSELVLVTSQQRQTLVALAERFDTPALIYNITTLEKLRWTIKNSESPRALLEAAILRLTLSEHFLSVPALLNQLQNPNSTPSTAVGIKKNSLIPADPSPPSVPVSVRQSNNIPSGAGSEPADESPEQYSQETSPDAETVPTFTPEDLLTRWPEFFNRLNQKVPGMAHFLEHASPVELRNNTLVMGFPPSASFTKTMFEGRIAKFSEAIGSLLGTPIQLRCSMIDAPSPARSNAAAESSSGMVPGRMSEVLNDPAVRTLLAGLNAKITSVETLEEDSTDSATDDSIIATPDESSVNTLNPSLHED